MAESALLYELERELCSLSEENLLFLWAQNIMKAMYMTKKSNSMMASTLSGGGAGGGGGAGAGGA